MQVLSNVASGGNFFSAQLVSAQTLSGLFSSVANLVFKGLASLPLMKLYRDLLFSFCFRFVVHVCVVSQVMRSSASPLCRYLKSFN